MPLDALKKLWSGFQQEPVAIQACVQAFIALGIAFSWWHWTNGEVGAAVGMVAAFLALITRTQVTPLKNPSIPGYTITRTPG